MSLELQWTTKRSGKKGTTEKEPSTTPRMDLMARTASAVATARSPSATMATREYRSSSSASLMAGLLWMMQQASSGRSSGWPGGIGSRSRSVRLASAGEDGGVLPVA